MKESSELKEQTLNSYALLTVLTKGTCTCQHPLKQLKRVNLFKDCLFMKPTQSSWLFRRDNLQFLLDYLQVPLITLDENHA